MYENVNIITYLRLGLGLDHELGQTTIVVVLHMLLNNHMPRALLQKASYRRFSNLPILFILNQPVLFIRNLPILFNKYWPCIPVVWGPLSLFQALGVVSVSERNDLICPLLIVPSNCNTYEYICIYFFIGRYIYFVLALVFSHRRFF
jgi:hypothetical protein